MLKLVLIESKHRIEPKAFIKNSKEESKKIIFFKILTIIHIKIHSFGLYNSL